ncbi:MAG: hypothetical protein Q8N05_15700 [Bacteroidota bacterium]|nr:hypothetical protein [Bacteroidota bacterium]
MILEARVIKVHQINQMNQSSDNVLAELEGGNEEPGGGAEI